MANILNLGLSAVATGTANAITATFSPAITLTERRIVFVTGCVANSSAIVTFNPNALGAKTVKGRGNTILKVGAILGDCIFIYHTAAGGYWELLNSNVTNATLDDILANGQSGTSDYALEGNSLTFNGNDLADQPFAQSVADTAEQNANTYSDGKVADSITNGVTTIAPSQNAVFDALALKQNKLIKVVMTGGNQTTTLDTSVAITELVATLEANTTYIISGFIHAGCNNTGGIFFNMTIPSGSMYVNLHSNTSAVTAFSNRPMTASGTDITAVVLSFNNTLAGIHVSGTITTGVTGGSCQLNYRSATAGQTSTIYQAGTFLIFTKVD